MSSRPFPALLVVCWQSVFPWLLLQTLSSSSHALPVCTAASPHGILSEVLHLQAGELGLQAKSPDSRSMFSSFVPPQATAACDVSNLSLLQFHINLHPSSAMSILHSSVHTINMMKNTATAASLA